jgi:hypothetical protein
MLSKALLLLWVGLGLTTPSLAHTVKNNNGVGATFHIEPNHNPRAGETATAWFALTKEGGKIIPLKDCNCQLEIMATKEGKEQTLYAPPLQPISTENYQGIPSAAIIFPKAGVYKLKIRGSPKSGNQFASFVLSYEVIVSPSNSIAKKELNQDHDQSTAVTPPNYNMSLIAGSLAGLGMISGLVFLLLKKK